MRRIAKPFNNKTIFRIMRKINLNVLVAALFMALFMGLQSCGGDKKDQNNDETAKTEHKHGEGGHTHGDGETKKTDENKAEVSPVAKAHVATLLQNYLTMKDAMVAADAAKTKIAAQATLSELEKFDASKLEGKAKKVYNGNLDMVKKHNTKISEATDVAKQREELDMLSMHMFALVKTFKANKTPLYKQFCPMAFNNKGANWLSDKKEIFNPYFGDKMLKCGSSKDSLLMN